MPTPKKVGSIGLSDATLSDSSLVMTQINKAALISWLNSTSGSNVAVFFQEDASKIHLVFAPIELNGAPNSSGQFSSPALPCPPYCK